MLSSVFLFFTLGLVTPGIGAGTREPTSLESCAETSFAEHLVSPSAARVLELLERPISNDNLALVNRELDQLGGLQAQLDWRKRLGADTNDPDYRTVQRTAEFLREVRTQASSTLRGESYGDYNLAVANTAKDNLLRADQLTLKWTQEGVPFDLAHLRELNRALRSGIVAKEYRHVGLVPETDPHGEFRSENLLGSGHSYIEFKDIPIAMEVFFRWFHAHEATMNPLMLAGSCYQWIVSIHPFEDGNGRTARAFADWILLSHGYPPMTFPRTEDARAAIFGAKNDEQNPPTDHAVNLAIAGVKNSYRILQLGFPEKIPTAPVTEKAEVDHSFPLPKEMEVLSPVDKFKWLIEHPARYREESRVGVARAALKFEIATTPWREEDQLSIAHWVTEYFNSSGKKLTWVVSRNNSLEQFREVKDYWSSLRFADRYPQILDGFANEMTILTDNLRDSFPRATDERDLPRSLIEWFSMPLSTRHPEVLENMLRPAEKNDERDVMRSFAMEYFVVEHILSQGPWADRLDLLERILRNYLETEDTYNNAKGSRQRVKRDLEDLLSKNDLWKNNPKLRHLLNGAEPSLDNLTRLLEHGVHLQ